MQKRIAELQAEVAHALGNLNRRGSQSLSNADGSLKNSALLEEAFTEAWDCLQRVKDAAEHAVAGSRIWMAPEMVTEVDAALLRRTTAPAPIRVGCAPASSSQEGRRQAHAQLSRSALRWGVDRDRRGAGLGGSLGLA
ncbi:MAG: hypothetical protein ABTD50_24515 [Polyangiaceae bacterium]